METIVTIALELALPGLVLLLWRAAERADREVSALVSQKQTDRDSLFPDTHQMRSNTIHPETR
jgi:hypothetical protein